MRVVGRMRHAKLAARFGAWLLAADGQAQVTHTFPLSHSPTLSGLQTHTPTLTVYLALRHQGPHGYNPQKHTHAAGREERGRVFEEGGGAAGGGGERGGV